MKQVYDNFLPLDQFKELQNIILHEEFPWRIRFSMTTPGDNLYFTYSFFLDYNVTSELYPKIIVPILGKLNCAAPIRVRANMFLSTVFEKSNWHEDYPYDSKTAILYLNSCDGGTEFKINDKIEFVEAKENRIVIFNTRTQHRVCSSKNCNARYIINFNYF